MTHGFENILSQESGEDFLKWENAQAVRRSTAVAVRFEKCAQITQPFRSEERKRERKKLFAKERERRERETGMKTDKRRNKDV